MNGNVRFYGGKTDPMEKRTRVRARVISHALKDILMEGDKVIIMGHKRPDLDAIGAAIGVSPVSYTHLTLPTTLHECRSRWSPYH